MTRGMLVTVLHRLAGAPQTAGPHAFADVAADAYYAEAVGWAASLGITSGTTATTFEPERAVTRQELAVLLNGYAQAMGYALPVVQAAADFTDGETIAPWAAQSVRVMQQAGIMSGRGQGCFDPQGTATRAETAAVLRRLVEGIGAR